MASQNKLKIVDNIVSSPLPFKQNALLSPGPNLHFGRACLQKLEETVREHGDTDFILDLGLAKSGKSLTRDELIQRSSAFASFLRTRFGIGQEKGHVVQISLPQCLDYFVYVLGVWLSGGIPSLTDPDLGDASTKHMLTLTKAKVVICTPDQKQKYER